jgi:hypothetical protein
VSEVVNGTWLDWNGKLRRAMGPVRAHPDYPGENLLVVELCRPEEWEAGDVGEGYDVARKREVLVLSDEEGREAWQAQLARIRRERAIPEPTEGQNP